MGPFGPISYSAVGHLFTKQLLCQLSYAGVLQRLAQAKSEALSLETDCKTTQIVGRPPGFALPPGLVLRLLLLLHVGGGLAALVLVVDLDHLFSGRLIAALRLRRWLRSGSFAFAAGHSQTVHPPGASTRERAHVSSFALCDLRPDRLHHQNRGVISPDVGRRAS